MANCRKPGVADPVQSPAAVKDGTLCLAPSPRQGMTGVQPRKSGFRGHGASGSWTEDASGFRGHGASGSWADDVAGWDTEAKLIEAARRTTPKLPAEMRDEFAALLSGRNLAITGGVLLVWAGSHYFGVGFIVDAILAVVGAFTIGWQIGQVAQDLYRFLDIAANAESEADLERASDCLARVVSTIGVALFTALIMKGGAKLKTKLPGRSTGRPPTGPSGRTNLPAPSRRPPKPTGGPRGSGKRPRGSSRRPRRPSRKNKNIDHSKTVHHEDGSVTYFDKKGRSVTYDKEGYPDFSRHAEAEVKIDGLTGKHNVDEALANKAVGLKETPDGYVWHHVQDGETMQLLPKDVHKTFPHTGGASKLK